MRNFSQRCVTRLRPVLTLETLEDRRVMSAGGLFSAFQPLAAEALHSPLSSTLSSIVAVPTHVIAQLGDSPQNLSGNVGDQGQARLLDVSLNLNVDIPFVHTQNLRLDVGLNPPGSDQPLVTVGLGGKADVGSTTGSVLNIVPEVQVGVGGSQILGVNGGGQVSIPSAPAVDVNAGVGAGTAGTTGAVHTGGLQIVSDLSSGGLTITSPVASAGPVSAVMPATGAGSPVTGNVIASTPAAIFGAPASAAVLTTPGVAGVDGGGGSAVDAAIAVQPTAVAVVTDGAAGTARLTDLGGGTEAAAVLVNPDMEPSGLTTRFQPFSLDAGRTLGSLLGQVAPQSGWLSAWLTRSTQIAPWLVGLIAAGTALEIRRRRHLKVKQSIEAQA